MFGGELICLLQKRFDEHLWNSTAMSIWSSCSCQCTRWSQLFSYLSVHSVAVLQPQTDAPAEQEEGAVHLAAVRRQHRPPDDDPHLAQLAGGLHQQLSLQLSRQQLVRTPVSRRAQVTHLKRRRDTNTVTVSSTNTHAAEIYLNTPVSLILSFQDLLSAFTL